MTPHQLYEWAQSGTHHLSFDFATENDHREEDSKLLS
jgi:hypothetical protein